jgi:hypothetical protein
MLARLRKSARCETGAAVNHSRAAPDENDTADAVFQTTLLFRIQRFPPDAACHFKYRMHRSIVPELC